MGKEDSSDLIINPFFYCLFRVAANPPSTLRIAKASGTIGAPVPCIPTVFPDVVVAAFTVGCAFRVSGLTPLLLVLKVPEFIDAVNR